MVSDEFLTAIEELKRADHSIFATLKYTRSCDVVMNVLERFTKTYANAIQACLIHAKDKKQVTDVPHDAKASEATFRQLYPHLNEYMNMYAMFRKILQHREYSCQEEFRKNLTMITHVDGQEMRINVEMIEHYYFEIKKFMDGVRQILHDEAPV